MNQTTDSAIYHVVFLKRAVLVARRPGADWQALQREFLDYKSSLGPGTLTDIAAWMRTEYGADAERDADLAAFATAEESLLSV